MNLIGKPPMKENHIIIDSLEIARNLFPRRRNAIDALCKRFEIKESNSKNDGLLNDAELTARVYLQLKNLDRRGSNMKSLEDVKEMFHNEFSPMDKKFIINELNIADALNNGDDDVNKPGIYIFWTPEDGVIKVGKSHSNSKKRALEHIRDNTHNKDINMCDLPNNKEAKLLLFNIINDIDLHWLLSLEAYMEWNINPKIKAGRIG